MKSFGETIIHLLQIILCLAIGAWFLLTVFGNVYGLITGKGTMQGQIKEKDAQIEELQEEIDDLKANTGNEVSISDDDLEDLYNRLYTEYISINSFNDIYELQTQYSDLNSDEYKQELMGVYEEYAEEIKDTLKEVFNVTDEDIESVIQ